jgi:hypothetical protein
MADPRVIPLQPEKIGGLLGRWPAKAAADKGSASEVFILKRIEPRTRFVLIALAAAVLFICLAYFGHGLTNPAGVRTTIGLIINPAPRPTRVSLPLLQDPVGLIAIAMTLLTPILFADQVRAIQAFNKMNEDNISYRAGSLDYDKINQEVCRTNKSFSTIGNGGVSIAIFLVSAVLSVLIDVLIRDWGLFPSWNKTSLRTAAWRHLVYAGWWANFDSHRILAVALWSLGCYFFYSVIKQVAMGACFATYVHRLQRWQFGVSPDMSANTDGYWGLRPARRFMQSTYSSALGHTIMILGILVVWLPFNAFTVFMLAVVLIINVLVVVYPSVVGHAGAYAEKERFSQYILANAQEPAEGRAAVIDKIWDRPTLPFRPRSALTAMTVYFLFPLLLAVVSPLLGR